MNENYEVYSRSTISMLMKWDTSKEIPNPFTKDWSTDPKLPNQIVSSQHLVELSHQISTFLSGFFIAVSKACEMVLSHNEKADFRICVESIKIFIKFWKPPVVEKLDYLHKLVSADESKQGMLTKLVSKPRTEALILRTLIDKINSAVFPASISFLPHVGSNQAGVVISETRLKWLNNPIERVVYRAGGPKNEHESSVGFFSYALIAGQHESKPFEKELFIEKGKNDLCMRVIFMTKNCGFHSEEQCGKRMSHLFTQICVENMPGRVILQSTEAYDDIKDKVEYLNKWGASRIKPIWRDDPLVAD